MTYSQNNPESRKRKRRRNKSLNKKAYLGTIDTYTKKFLKEGIKEEKIKEMTLNQIEETKRRSNTANVEPEVKKAIHNLVSKGKDREDINEEVLEEKLQSIMEKFKK